MSRKLTLVLGGARSGKSSHAEKLATATGLPVLYVATAEARDADMAQRIANHQSRRPAEWKTLEARLKTGAAIAAVRPAPPVVLVDCMTLLAGNAVAGMREPYSPVDAEALVGAEVTGLLEAWRGCDAHWIVISNETGLGIVPPYPLGRAYRDALGRANQVLAAAADEVLFMVAGLPMKLK